MNAEPQSQLRALLDQRHSESSSESNSTEEDAQQESSNSLANEANSVQETEPSDQELWSRIAAELRAVRDDQRDVFGELSDELLSRFLAGEATESELAEINEATTNDPELREALDALTWALNDSSALPADIPDAPRPLFITPAQDTSEADDDSQDNWQRVKAELQACRTAQLEAWGEIDERVLARFVADECSAEERRTVEAEMMSRPELREAVDHVRDIVVGGATDCFETIQRTPSAIGSDRAEAHQTASSAVASRSETSSFTRSRLVKVTVLATAACLLLAINGLTTVRLSQTKNELAEMKVRQDTLDTLTKRLELMEGMLVDSKTDISEMTAQLQTPARRKMKLTKCQKRRSRPNQLSQRSNQGSLPWKP